MRAPVEHGPVNLLPGETAVRATTSVLRMNAERDYLRAALEEVMLAVGASGARIWWRIRSDFPLTLWTSVNAPPIEPESSSLGPSDWDPIWTDQMLAVDTMASRLPLHVIPESEHDHPVEVWALIPSGTRARGAVVFWWDGDESPEIPEIDRELMREALSAFTAQIWWRERWAQRKLERELLDETSRLLATSLSRQEALKKILDLLARVVHFDAGGVFLIDDDTGDVAQIQVRGYDRALYKDLRLKIGQGLVGHVAKTGEIVNVPDISKDERYVNARVETRSTLLVPIDMRGRRIGVFNLESDRLAAYDPNDEWLLQAFATQVAITLDRASLLDQLIQDRRLHEQLSVARSIQQSFLPHEAPTVPGYDIAGVNFPSDQVGGDYFDFVPIVDGQWGIAIADVSGKGIPAALIMSGFRASLIAEIRNNYAIRTIFGKVNNLLLEMTAQDNFVTAFYGVLDANNRVLTFTNGGHNPPLLMRADGKVIRLTDGGPLMGVLRDATYHERPLWLLPGDILVMYTDGVTEMQAEDGEEFGEQRLIDIVNDNRQESADNLCQRIHEMVESFAGARAKIDDITMIIIKVDPE